MLTAYGGRYATSRFLEPTRLDAAHIVVDAEEELGQPVVSNGLPLTEIHHSAVDAHPIGTGPDYREGQWRRSLAANGRSLLFLQYAH